MLIMLVCMCVMCGWAKGLKGKTIYLNPGHGGYTTGDRPTATINHEMMDTLSFYETRSNLWKALETRTHLLRDGAKVIMSRTKSGYVTQAQMEKGLLNENQESHAVPSKDKVDPRFNRVETDDDGTGQQQIVALERIACQVDSIKPDYFLSMHSNAHKNGSKVNYLVMLFRGETGKPYFENSDSMARVMWCPPPKFTHLSEGTRSLKCSSNPTRTLRNSSTPCSQSAWKWRPSTYSGSPPAASSAARVTPKRDPGRHAS